MLSPEDSWRKKNVAHRKVMTWSFPTKYLLGYLSLNLIRLSSILSTSTFRGTRSYVILKNRSGMDIS